MEGTLGSQPAFPPDQSPWITAVNELFGNANDTFAFTHGSIHVFNARRTLRHPLFIVDLKEGSRTGLERADRVAAAACQQRSSEPIAYALVVLGARACFQRVVIAPEGQMPSIRRYNPAHISPEGAGSSSNCLNLLEFSRW